MKSLIRVAMLVSLLGIAAVAISRSDCWCGIFLRTIAHEQGLTGPTGTAPLIPPQPGDEAFGK